MTPCIFNHCKPERCSLGDRGWESWCVVQAVKVPVSFPGHVKLHKGRCQAGALWLEAAWSRHGNQTCGCLKSHRWVLSGPWCDQNWGSWATICRILQWTWNRKCAGSSVLHWNNRNDESYNWRKPQQSNMAQGAKEPKCIISTIGNMATLARLHSVQCF